MVQMTSRRAVLSWASKTMVSHIKDAGTVTIIVVWTCSLAEGSKAELWSRAII